MCCERAGGRARPCVRTFATIPGRRRGTPRPPRHGEPLRNCHRVATRAEVSISSKVPTLICSTARGDGLLAIQAGTVCRSMSGSHLTYPRLLEPEGRLRLRSCRPTRSIGPHGRQVALSWGLRQRPRAGGRGGDGRAGLALLNRWTSCLCVRTSGSAHARVAAGPSGLPTTA